MTVSYRSSKNVTSLHVTVGNPRFAAWDVLYLEHYVSGCFVVGTFYLGTVSRYGDDLIDLRVDKNMYLNLIGNFC